MVEALVDVSQGVTTSIFLLLLLTVALIRYSLQVSTEDIMTT
jgi:hypothetical protein